MTASAAVSRGRDLKVGVVVDVAALVLLGVAAAAMSRDLLVLVVVSGVPSAVLAVVGAVTTGRALVARMDQGPLRLVAGAVSTIVMALVLPIGLIVLGIAARH